MLSRASASGLMAQLYLRHTIVRGRSGFVILLVLVNAIVAFVVGRESEPERAFALLTNVLTLGFVLPFTALLYGIAVVRDEVEGGTLPYHLMRPVPRSVFYLGRLLPATLFVLAVGLLCTALNARLGGVSLSQGTAPGVLAAIALGSAAYTALFASFSALFKRPFLVGVLIGLIGEVGLSQLPLAARFATVRAHLENMAALKAEEPDVIEQILQTSVAVPTSYGIVLAVLGLALFVGLMAFEGREYTGDPQE